jgi:hypothetical protein
MTFSKPTYVQPENNIINGLEYSEIYIDSQRIGSLTKTKHVKKFGEHKDKESVSYTYDLEILYKNYQFKQSERKQIGFIIELEYTRLMLSVIGSIKDNDKLREICEKSIQVQKEVQEKWLPKYKDKIVPNLIVKE